MSTQSEQRLRVIRYLLTWQLIVALSAGVFSAALHSAAAGLSATVGGLICWLPSCWFAWKAFRYRGARVARQIVQSFYTGQAGKMFLTAGLFALAFMLLEPLVPVALFMGYVAVQIVNWVVPLVMSRRERQSSQRL